MHKVTIFGAGKIGEALACMLSFAGDYEITIADGDAQKATAIASRFPRCSGVLLTIDSESAVENLLTSAEAVISALPYYLNVKVANAAQKTKTHYFDLTEDVSVTKQVMSIAQNSSNIFMPQCGLAPGFISIAAHSVAKTFQNVDSIKMRVGALPLFPSNRLKYHLTWSTEGLINEYLNPCEAIEGGQKVLVSPLEGYERFTLDGVEYEAFNTSGGLGSLCDTMNGKVHKLNYKSVRYPGHRELIQFLLEDLRFAEDREVLIARMNRTIPTTKQDHCLIYVEVTGTKDNRLTQETYVSKVPHQNIGDYHLGAIQATTAAGVLAPLDFVLEGGLAGKKGFIPCETIDLADFLANRFGKVYTEQV